MVSAPNDIETVSSPARAHPVASPREALAFEEVLRMRAFCRIGIVLVFGGVAFLILTPGTGLPRLFVQLTLPLSLFGLLYLRRRTTAPFTFHDGLGVSVGLLMASAPVAVGIPYCGPFSPIAALVVINIYAVGLGNSSRLAMGVYVGFSSIHAITGTLVILGLPDPGFIRASFLSTTPQIVVQAMIQLVFAAAYAIARGSRGSQLVAIAALDSAVRDVAHREALLQEARDEFLRAAGTGRGRFTGQVLGSYTIGALIGRGGMGEVYEAVAVDTNEEVAIKLMMMGSLGNTQHLQRFMREMKATAAIVSPHVVRVISAADDPLPHLVMERLRGEDLATILRERHLDPKEVTEMVRHVALGLAAASALQIIHRDLKPSNVFFTAQGWKILDFGAAKVELTGNSLTAGRLIGTPVYMAPEQAGGGQLDHRVDVYALAAIAYRALTGSAPFESGELAQVIFNVVGRPPSRPSSLAPLNAQVDEVLAIGLAKHPADRFDSAIEFAEALETAIDEQLSADVRARFRKLVASRRVWDEPPSASQIKR
jgi:hypothetical protein